MRSHFNPLRAGKAGVTLFEALIALAILAAAGIIAAGAARGPSPALQARRGAAEAIADAAAIRDRAVRLGLTLAYDDASHRCAPGDPPLLFFPDGAAQGAGLCPRYGAHIVRLRLDPVTGRLRPEGAP